MAPTADTAELRKARGAFFTPIEMSRYIVNWAVRDGSDRVLEPSCGDAGFLLEAAARLLELGPPAEDPPYLHGVELHQASARTAQRRLAAAGFRAQVDVGDFFALTPRPEFDAVVGNPPYVRYQGFSGDPRARSRAAALRAGVSLPALASSWAAFTVHSAEFLRPGGRLGLVLPAELLSVNYAAEVRAFLMRRFRSIRLVLFSERVFPGVLEEVVLLLANGYGEGPTDHCELFESRSLADLDQASWRSWKPNPTHSKWTASLLTGQALEALERVGADEGFTTLESWGATTLGMVTGNNRYFALSPEAAERHRIPAEELLPLSPPGSQHLRRLSLTKSEWTRLGSEGRATLLFRPSGEPSDASRRYIKAGEQVDVHQAYKCRVRNPWWRVPLVPPPHLFLTYMNADTPRLSTNRARVHHLNSVHGVYLKPGLARLGMDLLPVASLNSMTLLGAELVGRAYGGGMLKIEPKEADRLPVPNPQATQSVADALRELAPRVRRALDQGSVVEAAALVDRVLLQDAIGLDARTIASLRAARHDLHARRVTRGATPRTVTG